MTKLRIIGDVHGKFNRLEKIIDDPDIDGSIVLGDVGIGFKKRRPDGDWGYYPNPPYDKMVKFNVRCIRGNHDNLSACKNMSYYIPDGTIEVVDGVKIMYIGGALSVDKAWRTEGIDWWADEELSYEELYDLIDKFAEEKPDIVMTHDVPELIAIDLERASGRRKLDINSRTRVAFQSMLSYHKPKMWLSGHWHYSYDQVIDGTRFIVLNELEHKDLYIGDFE